MQKVVPIQTFHKFRHATKIARLTVTIQCLNYPFICGISDFVTR